MMTPDDDPFLELRGWILIALIALLYFVLLQPAHADELVIHGVSKHQRDNERTANNRNYGIGIVHNDYGFGGYVNSEAKSCEDCSGITLYAMRRFEAYKDGYLKMALLAGLMFGYSWAPVLPILAPEVCYGVVCAIAVPDVVSVYLKLPI